MCPSNLLKVVYAVGLGLAMAATSGSGSAQTGSSLRAAASAQSRACGQLSHVSPASVGSSPQGPLDRSLLDQYCVTCHNERVKTASLMLDRVDVNDLSANAAVLEKVVRKLRRGEMPPAGAPRPDAPALAAYAASLANALDACAAAAPHPGRIAVRRLNRVEYVAAIHDLLALEIDGPSLLPADTSAFGFDNNAEALSVTPALMNRYLSAATKISRLAVGDPTIRPATQVYRASLFGPQDGRVSEALPFGTHGGLAIQHAFPLDGEYTFRIRLQREQHGNAIRGLDTEHEIEVRLDGARVQRFTVGGQYPGNDPGIFLAIPEDDLKAQTRHTYLVTADQDFEVRLPVKAGPRLVSVAFVDAAPMPSEAPPLVPRSIKLEGIFSEAGTPGIDALEIGGPYDGRAPADTPSRQRIFRCRPKSRADEEPCAKTILSGLARRAYRRPVTTADLTNLLELYRRGRGARDFEGGIERALEGLLSFPAFLFRIEQDPAGAQPGDVYRVSDVELASRLSFFLWKSVPDEELLRLAERGQLHEGPVLAQQVRRLLGDPKASRWMTDFVGQWLVLRNLRALEPDPVAFPEFDHTLRDAMATETERFFESQVREDHRLQELLLAEYTFLNDRLAAHYGIAGVYGGHFRRVPLTTPARYGLLGQASLLTVTSYAHRTSVVLRGKWVLENLLGAPPPPPPPNVPPLKENEARGTPTSLRERMLDHRKNPACASCHVRMDPMGFALEHFDAVGKWRDTESGVPIDTTTVLPDGTTIDSPQRFRAVLLRGDEFVTTVTEKLLTYALGRGLESYDAPTVRHLVRALDRDGYRWSSLVMGIVTSPPFQMRSVSGSDASPAVSTSVVRR